MLVSSNSGNGKFMTVTSAVQDRLDPDPHTYDGKLEQLERKIELQAEMIAELVGRLADRHSYLTKNDIEAILGHQYEVLED